jgi:uncharacterized protein (TIGR02996 family)
VKRNPGLLEAIAANPDDLGARRVYADWWLEQEEPRGEYVNAALTLTGRVDPATRKINQRRVEALFTAHGRAWSQELEALGARELRFSLGFVAGLTLADTQLDALEKALALEPVTHLVVSGAGSARLALALRSPAFDRLEHLTVQGDADELGPRLEQPRAKRLAGLVLKQVSGEGVWALAAREDLPALTRLSLTGTEAGDEGFSALGGCRLRLERLYAARSGVSDGGVAALVEAEGASKLELLALGGNEDVGDEAIEALTQSEHLGRLRELELGGTGVSDEGLELLADPEVLPALQVLDLKGTWCQPALEKKLRARKLRVR